MTTREIPREEWPVFFEQFSSQHAGWLVTLDLSEREPAQAEAHNLPLQGISLDTKGSDAGSVTVTVGSGDTQLTHVIDDPVRVQLVETPEGAHEALEFELKDGSRARLRFRVVALPETVDGFIRP